ncbi:MAG: dihydrofolate reductase family protein [Candidatus Portnoybacteria bacterium]|nr:dihydrofolate reductase family protein [Candidatus Portnoybacteria bacterium]
MKIIMLMATTVDGRIGKDSKHFPDWTSREDKKIFASESKKAGVVIMGGRTFDTFPAPLKERLNVVLTSDKERKEIPGQVKIYRKKSPKFIKEDLENKGFKKAILGGGAFVNGLFLKKKLVDEIIIIIAPKLFGKGLSLIDDRFDFDYKLKLLETNKINEDSVLLKYKILY